MADWEDFYEVLGVEPRASPEEILRAYRDKAREFHPDRLPMGPAVSEGVRRLAEEQMKAVNRAYEVLGNAEKRRDYDAEWRGRKSPPKPVVEPPRLHFHDVRAGETQNSSFIIRNVGGPYTRIRFNDPDSWVKILRYGSLTDADELPLKVEIEAKGTEWGKTYSETIIVHLDNAEASVEVELRTREAPTGQVPSSTSPTVVMTTKALIVARRKWVPTWGKWLVALGLSGIAAFVMIYFLLSEIHAKPSTLLASDADYRSLSAAFSDWGFDFRSLFETKSQRGLSEGWTWMWIGSSENGNYRIYFERVGDKWKPTSIPSTAHNSTSSVNQPPTSAIYYWDGYTYVHEQDNRWVNSDFTVYVYDSDHDGTVVGGEYAIYDNMNKLFVTSQYRKSKDAKTNTMNPLRITVGPGKDFPSRGEKAYTLYVRCQDDDGVWGEWAVATYNVRY